MSNATSGTGERTFSLSDVFAFMAEKKLSIILLTVISFSAACFVIVLGKNAIPKKEILTQNISIQLPMDSNSKTSYSERFFIYPNESSFSRSDILNGMVLKSVYENNHLQDKISFNDFSSSFFISCDNMRRAAIEALYQAKMQKKNISMVDLAKIEKEYQSELSKLEKDSCLSVSMVRNPKLTYQESVKVLVEIPETWFRIYSKIEAASYPEISLQKMEQVIAELKQNTENPVIALDMANQYITQMRSICETLQQMSAGRHIMLPSGATLESVDTDLTMIARSQFGALVQSLVKNPDFCSAFDCNYLEGNILRTEREIQILQNTCDGIEQTMDIIAAKKTASASPNGSDAIMQMDSAYVNKMEELIRKDVNNRLLADSAEELMKYKGKLAEKKAQNVFYANILKQLKNAKTASPQDVKVTREQWNKQLLLSFEKLMNTAKELEELQNMIIEKYVSARSFYASAGGVTSNTEYVVSLKTLIASTAVLWVLFNLFCFFIGFLRYVNAKQKKTV